MEVYDELERLKDENAKLKDRIVEYDEFANERAISDFAKDEEIAKLKDAISTCVGIIRASAQVNTKLLADKLERTIKGGA